MLHLRRTNVTKQISHVHLRDWIAVMDARTSYRRKAVCPDQMSVAKMEKIVDKLAKVGQLVVVPCVGTFATGKSFMKL